MLSPEGLSGKLLRVRHPERTFAGGKLVFKVKLGDCSMAQQGLHWTPNFPDDVTHPENVVSNAHIPANNAGTACQVPGVTRPLFETSTGDTRPVLTTSEYKSGTNIRHQL